MISFNLKQFTFRSLFN